MSCVYAVPNRSTKAYPTGIHPIKIGTPNGRLIRLTVLGPGLDAGIYVSNNQGEIDMPPPLLGYCGQIITQAGGQVQLVWNGELWAVGFSDLADANSPVFVDVDIGEYPLNP